MIAVTTAHKTNYEIIQKAERIGKNLGLPFLPREDYSIDQLISRHNLGGLLVFKKDSIVYKYPGGEFFFHPGMAKLRINEILNGKTDQMIKALDLRPGDSVLDCTLGLGSDAIVISYVNGGGEVIGLEYSPVISLIVKEGLAHYREDVSEELIQAMKRITVICSDYNSYLKNNPDNSVDIVYFDPMFRTAGNKIYAIDAIRPIANSSPLSADSLKEAQRVARRRVVVKESKNSSEFWRLGIEKISGGKHSPVSYGIIEKGGG
ncbi:MAG: class I SAM-dependent methyltransferase [Bacillota bacterium]